jgi:hypothetical protein
MSNNFYKNHIKENDIIKEIILKYDDILNNKNIINEGLSLVKLNSTNYSNLKYDMDGTKNDSVNKPLLDDINAAAKSVGIVATITTAKTGHSRLTKSKNVSRHMNGTGVDVSILDGIGSGKATNATNGSTKFKNLGFKLKDALVSMGYTWNTERGNDKAVLWHTNTGGNHYNHLHISNKAGSSSTPPTKKDEKPEDEKPEDEKPEDVSTDVNTEEKPSQDSQIEKLGLGAFAKLARMMRGDKEKTSVGNILDPVDKEDDKEDDKEEDKEVDKNLPNVTVDLKDYKITEPSSEDKEFYTKVLSNIGAPISKENLLFFYAWRQAEGAKSTYNPFNTTQSKEGSTLWNCLSRKNDKCVGGVRNYKTKQDGIDATVKTMKNGNYKCIVDGLKGNKGAVKIAECPDLKKWGTGTGVTRVLKTKKVNPPAISKTEVKAVKESFNYETKRILDLIKKVL